MYKYLALCYIFPFLIQRRLSFLKTKATTEGLLENVSELRTPTGKKELHGVGQTEGRQLTATGSE